MSDDDLHDAFGDRLTGALNIRSQRDPSSATARSVRRQARRHRARRRVMAAALTAALLAGAAYAVVDRSQNGTLRTIHPSATTAAPITEMTDAGLRSAATAYANAFLTGSYDDVIPMLDPACLPERMSNQELALARRRWAGYQDALSKVAGVDLADIEIRRVEVRNGDGLAKEAQVEFSLAASVAGNDNWIRYAFLDGAWHLRGCVLKLPIGGHSTGANSPTTTTTTQSEPPSPCTPVALRLALGRDVGSVMQQPAAFFTITNTSAIPCVLNGYPVLVLFDATGRTVPGTISHGGAYQLNDPGPRDVTVAPGETVYFGFGWVDTNPGNGDTNGCVYSARAVVRVPGSAVPLTTPARLSNVICGAGSVTAFAPRAAFTIATP
jgi:hypothetical protein